MKVEKSYSECKYIIGIGASAGGLEALQKLLCALPSNTGFPYIVVQHLSPDYKSLLGEILGKYTDMPVVQAEEGMEIVANHVYVIQPGKIMRLEKGVIKLTNQVPKELNLPIDMLFKSLAEDVGPRAIAIVLSGTGSDGTNGIKAIKENDGMVIVQDLATAKFDGMPRSAMRTGLVDVQISPEEIALELVHISGTAQTTQAGPTEGEIDTDLMKKVYMILKKVSNVNFTHYKQSTILRRMERRMMLTHKDKLSEYVDYLYESPEEVRTLSREVLIGVTNFFRDPEFFQSLKDKAIPEILLRSSAEEPIRAWVAGCSTGEEAYSIAILFSEVMEALKVKRDVKIFATDLDERPQNPHPRRARSDNQQQQGLFHARGALPLHRKQDSGLRHHAHGRDLAKAGSGHFAKHGKAPLHHPAGQRSQIRLPLPHRPRDSHAAGRAHQPLQSREEPRGQQGRAL